MPHVQRSSDIVEVHSERAISYGFGGLVALALSGLLFYYRGDGMLVPMAGVFATIGLGCLFYAVNCLLQVRKVTSVSVTCPYCKGTNRLIEEPEDDFTCSDCHRLIPIIDRKPIAVQQVRCGFCNELNYFSEKTDVLLCEYCNHEVPISHDDGHVARKKIASTFAVKEDERLYDLVLVAHGHKTDELVTCLQHVLSLNRNQVKQLLMEMPVTLLTGIPKKKAELLGAQIHAHEGIVESRPLP